VGGAVAGALGPIAALMAYHAVTFGSVWSTPYHHVVRPQFAATHQQGLLGLTLPTAHSLFEHGLSAWGGLLYWAPMVVVPVAAWVLAERAREADACMRVSMSVLVVTIAVTLGLGQTGGWRVGPRYLVLALPMAIPAWAWAARSIGAHRLAFAGLVAVVGWSAAVNLLAANLFPHLIPVGNPLADVLLPLWTAGLEPYSVLRAVGLEQGVLWVVALGTAAVVAVALRRIQSHEGGRAGPWIAGLGVAALLGAAALRLPSTPDAAANLAAIERIWEPRAGRPVPPSRPLPPAPERSEGRTDRPVTPSRAADAPRR
jgi:hypothetical protein